MHSRGIVKPAVFQPLTADVVCAKNNEDQELKSIIFILLAACIFFAGCNRVDISQYSGDGDIRNTGSYFTSYGYEIEFDTFGFSKPFSKEFKISTFPKIDKTIIFGVSTKSDKDELQKYLDGTLSLKVVGRENKEVFNYSFPLKKWTYGSNYLSKSKTTDYFIYYFESGGGSFIDTEDQDSVAPITLIVKYEPKSTIINLKGSIIMKSGGHN